ncbi:MAG: PhnD/SsuA/transferrin family substrate-binding protein [Chloroflexi bacterium]|nr:PhnD/SsuA/transferrin family substrate-binding protein [Chloroflexota bacterium]
MTGAFYRILPVFLVALTSLLPACSADEAGVRVSLAKIATGEKHIPDRPERGALKIAVAAMVTPRETLDVYREILDYVGEKLGRPVELVQRKTYAEVNDLLRRRLIDAAFICTQAYVEGKRDFGIELVVAPAVRGQAVYYGYIIVHRDSAAKNLEDLQGKTFAFSDPMSNTGKLFPTYLLAQIGETPDTFFSRYVFTYAHSNPVRSVAQGLVDGAAVDSLVWDYANATDRGQTSRTNIIYKPTSATGMASTRTHSG